MIFTQVDGDGDGFVSRSELIRAVDLSGLYLEPQQCRDMAAHLDVLGNNRIDYAPFIPGLQSAAAPAQSHTAAPAPIAPKAVRAKQCIQHRIEERACTTLMHCRHR